MALPDIWNKLSDSFERLNPRERIVVTVGGVTAVVIVLMTGWILLSQSVDTVKLRAKVKRQQVEKMVRLQATFSKREAQSRQLQRMLRGRNIRIVSHVEAAAEAAGVSIGNMTPREGDPDEDGIKETTVEIRLQKLSITRLQEFLRRLEATKKAVVKIVRLRMHKRYDDKTLLDVEMTVSTYSMG